METRAETPGAAPAGISRKQRFLDAYEREHAITMKVLRAFPPDQLSLRPHPRSKSARELAWVFVMERGLGTAVYRNEFAQLVASGPEPRPPESWEELLQALESAHREFGDLIRDTPDPELDQTVQFMTAPGTMGDIPRMEWLWFLLHDQIHHRGQFSVYLRMAGGKVPSIYGPSADEPWM
jgi:uncharacterized damage-inducible protein DinB